MSVRQPLNPSLSVMPCRSMRLDGYTLVEVLAVVAITALVAVAVTPGFMRVTAPDPLSQALQVLHEVDRLARQQAVGLGGSWSVLDGQPVSSIPGWQPTVVTLPAECGVMIQGNDGETVLEQVVLDRAGCSADLRLLVTCGERTRRFRIHGLCGRWEADEGTP
jgi:prepilin-type N-terminal cleavage/methylation domain-containing protein